MAKDECRRNSGINLLSDETPERPIPHCDEFILHWLVWHNNSRELDRTLASGKHDSEKEDVRGRTPLMLAVTLGHLESTRVLLRYTSNVSCENGDGWTVVQEATATGDPELLGAVLESRDIERYSSRAAGIPQLLAKLKEAPDFYVEMTWEFTSWVPLVSKICPSDTYRVYKRGSYVRIDTTLLGFDQAECHRGNRSYVFKGDADGAIMMEVDHDTGQVYIEKMTGVALEYGKGTSKPPPAMVSNRLTAPIVTTFLDTEKISFERDKAGIWGWRSDRSETVSGHQCKVFAASNVELVTRTRMEHLTDADKQKNSSSPRSPIQSFLTIAETQEKTNKVSPEGATSISMNNPTNITSEEYFDKTFVLNGRDIGRPREVSTKIQKFKAHLWLSEDYPLRLQEQVMPIVDLMAISSTHFAKLKDFIQMQLPSGFPVKIEIPLIHVLTARITFGNIFGLDEQVEKVTTFQEEDRISCILDDSIFDAPPGYVVAGNSSTGGPRHLDIDEDDAMLQYAIQQSLAHDSLLPPTMDEQIDIWEALQARQQSAPSSSPRHQSVPSSSPRHHSQPSTPGHVQIPSTLEDAQLQRVIEESLAMSQQYEGGNLVSSLPTDKNNIKENVSNSCVTPSQPDVSNTCHAPSHSDIALALSLSQQQHEEEEARIKQEEEILKQILELSLTEK